MRKSTSATAARAPRARRAPLPVARPAPLISGAQAVAALSSGAAAALTVPPFGLGWLAWVAFVPLLHAVRTAPPLTAFACGALTGVVLFIALSYGVLAFHAGAFALVVSALALLLGLVLGTERALTAAPLPAWLRPLVLPSLWVLAERLSSAASVPWAAALSQAATLTIIQSAAVLGAAWLSFLVLLCNRTIALLVAAPAGTRDERRAAVAALLLLLAGLGPSVLYGRWCLAAREPPASVLRIAGVQPVIMPDTYRYEGMIPAYRAEIRAVIDALSGTALAGRPDLLVWPEGGNGEFNFRVAALRDALTAQARAHGATLLVSSYDLDGAARLTNSVFSVAPSGEILGRYDKVRLTPLGEQAFSPGEAWIPLPTPFGPVGALVCFESTFAAPARAMVAQGAELLLITTSDAAFRNSNLGVLHARFAVLRAVENRRAVIEAANTGPSFVVSPYGEIDATTPLFARTTFSATVEPRRERTPFTRFGEWPLSLGCALVGLGALIARRRRDCVGGAARVNAALDLAGGGRLAAAVGGAIGAGALLAGVSLLITSAGIARFDGAGRAALAFFARADAVPLAADTAAAFQQQQPNTCGPAALAFLANYLGVAADQASIAAAMTLGPGGSSMAELVAGAERLGFSAWGERQNLAALRETPKPLIAHIRDDHYVVVLGIDGDDRIDLFDPARGYVRVAAAEFARAWHGAVLLVRFRDLAP